MPRTTKEVKTENLNKKETVAKSAKTRASSSTKKTTKATTTKKTSTNKSATKATKTTTRKSTSTKAVKKLEENIVAEYYDLPYRYNETIVKILYQTPNVLFVYWDISDYDRNKFINEYGENFFNNTVPILKVFNLTKNYSFEMLDRLSEMLYYIR